MRDNFRLEGFFVMVTLHLLPKSREPKLKGAEDGLIIFPYEKIIKIVLHAVFQFAGLTLNSLGTKSLGVFTPTKASTPQKRRMVKMMAKSLISFLTCGRDTNRKFSIDFDNGLHALLLAVQSQNSLLGF